MASLQLVRDHYHVSFRCFGHRYKRSLKTTSHVEATARKARIEEVIHLLESGRLEVPDHVDVPQFVLVDGRVPEKQQSQRKPRSQQRQPKMSTSDDAHDHGNGDPHFPCSDGTLEDVFTRFFAAIPDGNLEATTLSGMHIHERHLLRILKPKFRLVRGH